MKSNFVLFRHSTSREYWVSERVGLKHSYYHLTHFIDFFETPEAAWKEAIRRQQDVLKYEKEKLDFYKEKLEENEYEFSDLRKTKKSSKKGA